MCSKHQSPATILIVQSDEDDRCLLKSILKLKGFNVIEAADGQAAINLAIRKLPDLIIIDLKLPGLSGFSAIRRMKKYAELRATPIIAVSLNHPTSHGNLALAAGCAAHLEKPIEFDHLDLLIDRLLPGERLLMDSVMVH
jgi:two-component system, cell cycle response regulator DivK